MIGRNSRVVATVAAVSVSGAVLAAASPAGATPTSGADYDLRGAMTNATDRLDALSTDVTVAQESLTEAERALPAAQAELNDASVAMTKAQAEEAAATAALREAEAAVAKTKADIEAKQVQIAELKDALSVFARDVYTGGSNEMQELSVVLGAQGINDVAAGLAAIEKVSRNKNKAVEDYIKAKMQLDAALVGLKERETAAAARRQAASDAVDAAAAAESRAHVARDSVESIVVARTQALGVINGERALVREQYDDLKVAHLQIEATLREREVGRALAEKSAREAAQAAAKQATEIAAQAEAAAKRAADDRAAAAKAAEQAATNETAAAKAYRAAIAAELARRNAAEAASAAENAANAAAGQPAAAGGQPGAGFAPEAPPAVSSGGWVYPVAGGYNSSPPGSRSHPAYGYWSCHKGEDIAAPLGAPILAASAGRVISSGWNDGGYGNMTMIEHGNGVTSLYAHQNSVAVFGGQSVSAGQVIGYVGSTGDSTGPHLHFEISVGGVPHLPSGWFGGPSGPVPC